MKRWLKSRQRAQSLVEFAFMLPLFLILVFGIIDFGMGLRAYISVAQATREGARFFFNPIRPGSTASKERVLERSTGKELAFEVVNGKEAKASGLVSPRAADDALFLKVHLTGPVPKGGETRIRIYKTYTDAPSYYLDKDGQLVFDRPLGIKRNTVVLPAGWELVGCASPGMVSTDPDGRIRVSFLNDRDDQLPVKIVARRLP